MSHVLVDLVRLLVLAGLHFSRDIALVAEGQTEGIQDTRFRCGGGQVASFHAARGSAASLRMIGAPIFATPVPPVLQRCRRISKLSSRMFVIVSPVGSQSFEPQMRERPRPPM